MKRLVINGHTPATELVHPKLKTKQLFITRDDADAYVSGRRQQAPARSG